LPQHPQQRYHTRAEIRLYNNRSSAEKIGGRMRGSAGDGGTTRLRHSLAACLLRVNPASTIRSTAEADLCGLAEVPGWPLPRDLGEERCDDLSTAMLSCTKASGCNQ